LNIPSKIVTVPTINQKGNIVWSPFLLVLYVGRWVRRVETTLEELACPPCMTYTTQNQTTRASPLFHAWQWYWPRHAWKKNERKLTKDVLRLTPSSIE
jgi:hypothetical protein